MGIEVDREEFSAEDHTQFAARLQENLATLRDLLGRPGFGAGEPSVGVEVELHLADDAGQPACRNEQVRTDMDDARCTLEIDAFNIELNSRPQPLAGTGLSALGAELTELLGKLRTAAAVSGTRVVSAGTLPTLTLAHLRAPGVLSDSPRYRAMSNALRAERAAPFPIHIEGREVLVATCDDLTLEGANASLQVHLRVPPGQFAHVYNAALLAAAPLLAVTGNSPYFDNACLWEESRIALFKQATDTRRGDARQSKPARVSFGRGYIQSALEPFEHNVAAHAVLLPALSQRATVDGVPALDELRLHHGTVWDWNRAVYDPGDGGHLRLEHRLVACGPTQLDMLANTAFTLGLSLGLAPLMAAWTADFPFGLVEQNAYSAAKHGLAAQIAWPSAGDAPRQYRARDLVLELLPLAERALVQHGVDSALAEELLTIVRERAESGQTGAVVQRRWVERFERDLPRDKALARMLDEYIPHCESELPVHRWSL